MFVLLWSDCLALRCHFLVSCWGFSALCWSNGISTQESHSAYPLLIQWSGEYDVWCMIDQQANNILQSVSTRTRTVCIVLFWVNVMLVFLALKKPRPTRLFELSLLLYNTNLTSLILVFIGAVHHLFCRQFRNCNYFSFLFIFWSVFGSHLETSCRNQGE